MEFENQIKNSNSIDHDEPKIPKYKECLRNHAAVNGGHAVDGCGEFMPAGDAFICAACNCHRNFHRKETQTTGHHIMQRQRPLGGEYREDRELEMCYTSNNIINDTLPKKRFRTKFSQEHKDKMLILAEKLGWRIQSQEEEVVQQLCIEIGIKRHVFKVWMHNNKHRLGKKLSNPSTQTNP